MTDTIIHFEQGTKEDQTLDVDDLVEALKGSGIEAVVIMREIKDGHAALTASTTRRINQMTTSVQRTRSQRHWITPKCRVRPSRTIRLAVYRSGAVGDVKGISKDTTTAAARHFRAAVAVAARAAPLSHSPSRKAQPQQKQKRIAPNLQAKARIVVAHRGVRVKPNRVPSSQRRARPPASRLTKPSHPLCVLARTIS